MKRIGRREAGNYCRNVINQVRTNGGKPVGKNKDKCEYVLYLDKDYRCILVGDSSVPIAYTLKRRIPYKWKHAHETRFGRFEYEAFPLSPFQRICISMAKEMRRMQAEV